MKISINLIAHNTSQKSSLQVDILVCQIPVNYERSVGVEVTESTRDFEADYELSLKTQVGPVSLKELSKVLPHSPHNEHGFVRRLVIERSAEIHHVRVIHLLEELAFSREIRHNLLKVALASSRFQKQTMYP